MIHVVLAMIGAFGTKGILSGGSGGTVSQVDGVAPYDSNVAIRFNEDGTVETGKSQNGAAISWSSAGSWITPNSLVSGNEEVRFTNLSQISGSTDWTTEAAADDAWVAISGGPRVFSSNKSTSGTRSFSCDFEVRDTVENRTTGTASYTFTINNTV